MSSIPPRLPVQRAALGVLAATVIIRLFVVLRLYGSAYPIANQGDMRFYADWAARISEGNGTDGTAFYGLPGYAYLLAGIFKILGSAPLLMVILQALAEGFFSFMIFSVANLIYRNRENTSFGPIIGTLAALGYAFYLPAQTFSIILMPTCLVAAFFWFLIWWCLRGRSSKIGWAEAAGLGAGIGLVATMVATIFFVIPLMLVMLYLRSIRWVVSIPLLFAGVLLGCSPVIYYNRVVAHDSVALSAHGGLNFFIGNNLRANGYLVIPDGLRANQTQMLSDSITVAEKALQAYPGEKIPRSAVSSYWSRQASAYIREHPAAWLKLEGQKIINFWNAYQYDDLSIIRAFSSEGISTSGIRFGIAAALGLSGMLVSVRSPYRKSRWVIAAILLHLGSLLTVFITERYRLVAVPGLLILGAYFVVQLWQKAVCQNWKTVSLHSFTCLLTTLFVTLPVPNQGAWALDTYNDGIRQLAMKNWPKAREQLELAWRYAPENDNTNLAVGNFYLLQNDLPRAAAFFRRSLLRNPRNTATLNNLGFIALAQDSPAEAVIYYGKTLQLAPDHLLASYQLAAAYRKNQEPAEALRILEKGLLLHPGNPQLLDLQQEILTQQP